MFRKGQMPKIETVGVGKFIRNPRGRHSPDSRGTAIEVLQIASNNGNSFTCFPVTAVNAGPDGPEAVLDTTRYQDIPIGTNVEQASI